MKSTKMFIHVSSKHLGHSIGLHQLYITYSANHKVLMFVTIH